ncbi:MAG: hypothetical protein CVT64_11080 [Actinobacteria bacterium HGW-Actinobacteria-4]|nr:MAG: hypothetical protein CVT64_11080 [Actinobacteria bacterium HGW-Actinobacteria-4]
MADAGLTPATDVAATPSPAFTENVTPAGGKDGLIACISCGASEVTYNAAKGMFRCAFCRHEWADVKLDDAMGLSHGIGELTGTTLSSNAMDIASDEALVTMKCTGCGAEVVVNTDNTLQARCHWCKHTLSINNRIGNGAVPDGILPFTITKQQAMASISEFAGKRKTFQHPEFTASFKPENIMGVYMPYMTVDGNISAKLDGVGETLTKTVRREKQPTIYHARQFKVGRTLDLHIDDLIVETSSDKVDIHSDTSTNNIINAVLPFDVKNIARFDANFLGTEYTSERRDMDVKHAESYAVQHFMTIARGAVQSSVSGYDRGVRWDSEHVNVKGTRWTAVLLPVWLYGFVETKKGKQITHYIAVNGRNGYVMGSIPINTKKARTVCWIVTIVVSLITWPMALGVVLFG